MANQNYGGEQHMIDIEEIPPIPTNQNSSTSSHVHSLDSGLCLSIQLILTVTQMVASLVVLWVSMAQEHRYPKLFPWVMGYASGCALMLPLLYSRYHIARTLNLGYVFVDHSYIISLCAETIWICQISWTNSNKGSHLGFLLGGLRT